MTPVPDDPRELAEAVLGWLDADIKPVDWSLRLAATDKIVLREARRILTEELIPEASAREADEGFKKRGRYLNQRELDAMAAEAAQRQSRPVDLELLLNVCTEAMRAVLADYPDARDDEFERLFRQRLAKRAGQ